MTVGNSMYIDLMNWKNEIMKYNNNKIVTRVPFLRRRSTAEAAIPQTTTSIFRCCYSLKFTTMYLLSMGRARFSIPSFLAGCLLTANIYRSVSVANMIEKDYQSSIAHIDEFSIKKVVQADSLLSWQSPHFRDCNEVATIMTSDSNSKTLETEARFVQTNATLHAPSFLMSIHNPSKDGVSQSIYQNGCWECDGRKHWNVDVGSCCGQPPDIDTGTLPR